MVFAFDTLRHNRNIILGKSPDTSLSIPEETGKDTVRVNMQTPLKAALTFFDQCLSKVDGSLQVGFPYEYLVLLLELYQRVNPVKSIKTEPTSPDVYPRSANPQSVNSRNT
jgi:hypothetical protein